MHRILAYARRALCVALGAAMLAAQFATAEGFASPLPTPTPLPPSLTDAIPDDDASAREQLKQPDDTSAQDDGDLKNGDSISIVSAVPPDTPEPSPEATADNQASIAPDSTATPETAAPSDSTATPEATATPSASPTPEITSTPEPAATPEPVSVEPAEPVCTDDSCPHVGLNDEGDPIALCPVGERLLIGGDGAAYYAAPNGANVSSKSASLPIAYALRDGKNTIYRSGTYELTGGGAQARLDVARGLAVSLMLKGVQLLNLNLRDDVVAMLRFTGANVVSTIAAPAAALTIDGTGCLYGVSNLNALKLNVLGGSVALPDYALSDNGRKPYVFDAAGTTAATVDGESYPYTMPCPDDSRARLWLPMPSGGAYTSLVSGSTLVISSMPNEPDAPIEYNLSTQTAFVPVANTAYSVIAGDAPVPQTLAVGVDGVSLALKDIGETCGLSISATERLQLYMSGQSVLAGLTAVKELELIGSGSLCAASLDVPLLTAAGGLTVRADTLASVPSGWCSVAVNGALNLNVKAYYEGRKLPLLYTSADTSTALMPLSAPQTGFRYAAALNGDELQVDLKPDTAVPVMLDNAGLTLTSGAYELQSAGEVSGDLTIDNGATVTLTLSGARTSGRLIIGDGARVTLTLAGSSRFGAGSNIGAGAELNVSGQGSLLMGDISGGAGCVLGIGDKVNLSLVSGDALPFCALKPTVISVTDDNDAPLCDKRVTLKLGTGESFDVFTAANGHITLWRPERLKDVDAIVLSGDETYAAVIINGQAAPNALPVITGLTHVEYGSVSFTTDIPVMRKGVMYMVSAAEEELPDAFVATARFLLITEGDTCDIPDLKNGDVVTYRAFASVGDAGLSAATQDAYAFSEKRAFTVRDARKAFTMKKQTKTYDGERFKLAASKLPKDATVKYLHDGEELQDAPYKVGDYIARVTVPTGDAVYLPGSYDVEMSIERIVVIIYPDFAMKRKGEEDPPLTFEYDESVMLDVDEVTGTLTRRKGEFYGNYAYLTDKLVAEPYYKLVIDEECPAFFIDWNSHHYIPFDPLAVIDPVFDEITLSNGKKVSVQIRTSEQLKLGETLFNNMVTDTLDGKARPVTPTLRLRGGYDSILLILTAEPELNADGGYATDENGRRLTRGRELTLSYWALDRLGARNIDYIAFSLDGVMALVSLDDLRIGGAADEALEQNGLKHVGTSFVISMEPVSGESALLPGEGSAAEAASVRERLMRVGVRLENGDAVVDLTPWLTDASICFDAGELMPEAQAAGQTDVIEMVNGKPVTKAQETEPLREAAIAAARGEGEPSDELMLVADELLGAQIARYGYSVCLYGDETAELQTKPVVPYTESEKLGAEFNALMRSKPYLSATLDKSGLYGLSRSEE